jgi:hypothetical protein
MRHQKIINNRVWLLYDESDGMIKFQAFDNICWEPNTNAIHSCNSICFGTIYFDGVRHLYFHSDEYLYENILSQEKLDDLPIPFENEDEQDYPNGYVYYPNMEDLELVLAAIQKLAYDKFAEEYPSEYN